MLDNLHGAVAIAIGGAVSIAHGLYSRFYYDDSRYRPTSDADAAFARAARRMAPGSLLFGVALILLAAVIVVARP
jgi:hypothetical protein